MSSKKRPAATDAETLAMLALKMPKDVLSMAMISFMDNHENAAYELLDHMYVWDNAMVNVNYQSRTDTVIKTLISNRPTLAINLEKFPTYEENPDTDEVFSIYNECFKNNEKNVLVSSIYCFGRYMMAAIADSGITQNEYLEKITSTGKLKMRMSIIKRRIGIYRFLQQFPMFVNTSIGYGYLVTNMGIIKELFSYFESRIEGYISTNNRYLAWCNSEISSDELYTILTT